MADTKEIVRGGMYITFASILAFIFGYVFRIILARSLPIEEYGLFYSIWNFLTFFLFFIYLGLDQASVHYIVKYNVEKSYDKIKSVVVFTLLFQLVSTLIFVAILFLLQNFLETDYFRYENSGFYLLLMGLFLIFNVIGGVGSGLLYGLQKMKMYSLYQPLQNLLYLLTLILFLGLGLAAGAPFWAYLSTSILLMLIFVPIAFRYLNLFRYKIMEFWATGKILFIYGFPVMLAAVSSRLLLQTDTLMLTRMTSLQEVGLYQVALPIATVFTFLSAGIIILIFPVFTEMWHKNEKDKISFYLQHIYKYLFLLLLLLITLFGVFGEEIITLMFGKAYLDAEMALLLLLVATLFNVFSSVNLQSIAGFGSPKLVSKIVFFGAGINVLLNAIFIYWWGINGAALATLISYVFLYGYSKIKLQQMLEKNIYLEKSAVLTAICGLLFGAMYFYDAVLNSWLWGKLLIALVFCGGYTVVLFKAKVVNWEELKGLWEMVTKKSPDHHSIKKCAD